MSEEADGLRRRVWGHLQAGEWHSAMALAERLSEIDEPGGDGDTLVKAAGTLARMASAIRLGQPLDNDALFQLDRMARAWPRLAEARSFQTLVQAAKKAGVAARTTPRKEPASSRPASQVQAKRRRQKSKRSLLKRITRPKGWAGIAATVASVCLIVLVCNLLAGGYLVLQPCSANGPEAQGFRALVPLWRGLDQLSDPVDTLILGDSNACDDLMSGPIADRLGGSAFNLGGNASTGLLWDAWMLQYYVDRFGPPRNVILLRSCVGYEIEHSVECMSVVPLDWGYWDRLGLAPVWKAGEKRALLLSTQFPLYSESDILSYRVKHPNRLFSQPAWAWVPGRNYSSGPPSKEFDFGRYLDGRAASLFGEFSPSSDSTNALRAMSDLAASSGFQLYIAVGPQWDEAYKDPAGQSKVSSMREWLTQFTDSEYVHLVLEDPMAFRQDQMQSPGHLYLDAARQYTEAVLAEIVAIQNRMTAIPTGSVQVTSAASDKTTYTSGEEPMVTLSLTANGCDDPTATIAGSVSGLVRPSGKSDGEWIARSQALTFTMECGKNAEVKLQFSEGEIDEAGLYDLVLFVRQDAGGLSFETRLEFPTSIEVK